MACASRPLVLALAVAAGCAAERELPPPLPLAVEPASGFSTYEMPITILGDAFLVRASQSVEGEGGDVVSGAFRAWLGEVELLDVDRVDERTLTATVPGGVVPGSYDLVVEGPSGRSAPLPGAYRAIAGPAPVIKVEPFAEPPVVTAGETGHVRVRVTNLGPGALTRVKLQLKWVVDGHASTPVAGGPDPRDLAVGERFDWSYDVPTTAPGTVELEVKVSGIDPVTGAGVSAPRVRVTFLAAPAE